MSKKLRSLVVGTALAGLSLSTLSGCRTDGTHVDSRSNQTIQIEDGEIKNSSNIAIRNALREGPIKAAKDLYSTVSAPQSFEMGVPISAFAAIAGAPIPDESNGVVTLRLPQEQKTASEALSARRVQTIQANRLKIEGSSHVTIDNVIETAGVESSGSVIVQVAGTQGMQKVALSPNNVLTNQQQAASEVQQRKSEGKAASILKAQILDPVSGVLSDAFVSVPAQLIAK